MLCSTCIVIYYIPGLLILGGYGAGTSVELWHSSLPACRLPDLPREMSGHSVDSVNGVIITCLGDTCESFQEGSWPTLVSTIESRSFHSSVVHGDRLVLLGDIYTRSTEVIPPTGEAAMPGLYDISNSYKHCSIDIDHESVVVVGGVDTPDLVTEYNKLSGHPRTLPSLQEPRRGHACTWYTQGHDKVT